MRKISLQIIAFAFVFGAVVIINPIPQIGYTGVSVPMVKDLFDFLLVIMILTAMESPFGKELGSDVIPPAIKNIIGATVVLVVGAFMMSLGWIRYNIFEVSIVMKVPITLSDVFVLMTTGGILFWAGGLAYGILIDTTNSMGNVCWWFLKKVGLGDPEEVKDDG